MDLSIHYPKTELAIFNLLILSTSLRGPSKADQNNIIVLARYMDEHPRIFRSPGFDMKAEHTKSDRLMKAMDVNGDGIIRLFYALGEYIYTKMPEENKLMDLLDKVYKLMTINGKLGKDQEEFFAELCRLWHMPAMAGAYPALSGLLKTNPMADTRFYVGEEPAGNDAAALNKENQGLAFHHINVAALHLLTVSYYLDKFNEAKGNVILNYLNDNPDVFSPEFYDIDREYWKIREKMKEYSKKGEGPAKYFYEVAACMYAMQPPQKQLLEYLHLIYRVFTAQGQPSSIEREAFKELCRIWGLEDAGEVLLK
jgi:hypothetical protein